MDGFVREYRPVYLYLLCPPLAVGYYFYVDVVILLSLILLYPDYLPCSHHIMIMCIAYITFIHFV